MSVGAVVPIIAQAAEIIRKHVEQRNFESWRDDVSGSLQTIIAQNLQILSELRSLRVHVSEELERKFREEHALKLNTEIKQFDTYILNVRENIRNGLFFELRDDLEESIIAVLGNGPGIYPSLYTAGMSLVAVYTVTGARRSELTEFFSNVLPTMDFWAQDVPGHFSHAAKLIRQEMVPIRADIMSLNGRIQINTYVGYGPDRPDRDRVRDIPEIPGTAGVESTTTDPTTEFVFPASRPRCSTPVFATVLTDENLSVSVTEVAPARSCAGYSPDFNATVAKFGADLKAEIERRVGVYRQKDAAASSLEQHHNLLVTLTNQLRSATGP